MGQTDFDQAILRAVAGVEKKRSILQGAEKESVAKHECGHALVSTAIASLIPTFNQVLESPVCCQLVHSPYQMFVRTILTGRICYSYRNIDSVS